MAGRAAGNLRGKYWGYWWIAAVVLAGAGCVANLSGWDFGVALRPSVAFSEVHSPMIISLSDGSNRRRYYHEIQVGYVVIECVEP